MKRMIALSLAVILTLALCACGGSGGESKPAGLQVGYSKIDITPDFQVSLNGYNDTATRLSTGFITYIYITCIAMRDGEDTVLLYTIDNLNCSIDFAQKIRDAVTPATGVPGTHIFAGAIHSHSCPVVSGKYENFLLQKAVEAAEAALADLSPATINAATPTIEGMNFVRHYNLMDGTVAGPNFGGSYDDTNIVGHAAEPDDQMVLIQFDRGEDKKDVLLVNWQAHPASGKSQIDYNSIAADFVGPLRDALEAKSGMQVAYFTGAGGDLVTNSAWSEDKHHYGWREYGEKLGELAYEALSQLKPVEGSGIAVSSFDYDAPINHEWDNMIQQANEVYDLWQSMGKEAGDALGETYNFTSVYQAKLIRERYNMEDSTVLPMHAFRVGGVGFANCNYEMFAVQGRFIKENSPMEVNFIVSGNHRYVPSKPSYDYRCYEADCSLYAPGTGEAMADKFVEMLKGVAPAAE